MWWPLLAFDLGLVSSCTFCQLKDVCFASTVPSDLESMPVGASCLPSSFTKCLRVPEEGDPKLQLLDHYSHSSGDAAAALEIFSAIEATSHFGVDQVNIARQFQHYEEAVIGRTRVLRQYLQVGMGKGGKSPEWALLCGLLTKLLS